MYVYGIQAGGIACGISVGVLGREMRFAERWPWASKGRAMASDCNVGTYTIRFGLCLIFP